MSARAPRVATAAADDTMIRPASVREVLTIP